MIFIENKSSNIRYICDDHDSDFYLQYDIDYLLIYEFY